MWKDLWKRSIALGDVASWNVLMFLKIVTKWPEIQKSNLNNSLFTFYSITYFTIFTCFAISWNFNFAVNLVTSFSCQEPSKLKKKDRIFWEYKVLPSCKVWAQTNKKCEIVSRLQLLRPMGPPWKWKLKLLRHNIQTM